MADPDTHAPVVIPNMGRDRAQPVVSSNPASGLHPHLARREIDLVVEHHDVGKAELVEVSSIRHGAAGVVHIGAREKKQRTLASERPFSSYPLKPPPPGSDTVALGNGVDRHETDIVPVPGIARTGIAEPDQEQHRA